MTVSLPTRSPLFVLSILAVVLLLISSVTGLISDQGGSSYAFTSLRGEVVEVYGGAGLYQFDSTYKAIAFRSFDWVNLMIVLPLFGVSLYLYRRGHLRGQLLLAALFTYLAYIYLIGVMGNAFNGMFLVWTALFSIGLFGLFLTLAEMNVAALPARLEPGFPRRSVAIYVVGVGLILLFQYLAEIITAYATGQPPASLDHYTTLELAALELGIMIPLHFVGGVALWKRQAAGYLMSTVLAFAAAMVFVALSISLLIGYASFGRGDPADLIITLAIAVFAAGFSFIIFKRVKA
jgi:hypothetical protein